MARAQLGDPRYYLSHMTFRRSCPRARGHVWALVVALHVLTVATAAAQGSTATVEVRFDSATASPTAAAVLLPIRLESLSDATHAWSAQIESGRSVRFRFVPPGRYRIVSGTVERPIEVASGDELTISVSRDQGQAAAGADTTFRVSAKDRNGYGTRFNDVALKLLPESSGVYGLIERSDPLVVTDLMEGGGTYLSPQRLGASGASWTQTSFRLGDADLTDPDRTGFSMLYPNLNALEAVSVTTAGGHPDSYGSGTMVMLTPRMPASTWQRTFEFMASPSGFQSVNPLPGAPALARLRNSASGSFVLSGPVTDRLGLHMTGNLAASTRVERNASTELPSNVATLSGHVVYRASDRDHVQIFAEGDRLTLPTTTRGRQINPAAEDREQSMLVTATWNRSRQGALAWSGSLTLGQASSTPPFAGDPLVASMERLRDGPVYEMAAAGESRRRRTALSWRGEAVPVRWLGLRHHPEFGATASWTGVKREAPGSSLLGELVDGEPARAWEYTSDGGTSRWGGSEAALWGTDEIAITPRIDVDLGLRASTAGASREGANIRWNTLSPSILGTYRAINNGWLTFLAGYAEYDARLPLNYLAFGDPHALTGSVHRWNDVNADRIPQTNEVGVTIAAVGPCCANGRANVIDDELRAPRMKEIRAVLQTKLGEHIILRLGGTDRRQYNLPQVVNLANVPENYVLTHVDDHALDILVEEDDQLLPIWNRVPASFNTDSYVLQNVDHNSARNHGMDLVLERPFDGRWGMLIGGTAHKSEGIGGNRGYLATENDQGVLGEIFSDANAQTNSRGRVFFERGYVAKWSAMYQLPYGIRGGSVARYQDGQHFSRVVIAHDLNQGTEFVPALPRGLTRFTYTFTLDTRLEKQLLVGGRRAAVILDVFNLLNTNNEIEEDEVTGPNFRQPTAVQPPRTVRLGLRVTF
jgi:hypothetical protein